MLEKQTRKQLQISKYTKCKMKVSGLYKCSFKLRIIDGYLTQAPLRTTLHDTVLKGSIRLCPRELHLGK